MPHRDVIHTIAFYNIENLFDTINDPMRNDDDFLPTSRKRWTKKRYQNKLRKIGSVISNIGPYENNEAPAIIGLAEVENKRVLSDLINSKHLNDEDYSFVHYDSSDERGIDVALLYKSNLFKLEYSETYSIYLETDEGLRDYTRDILLVKGELYGESLTVLINHWSSRTEGEKETEHKRIASAEKVLSIIDSIKSKNENERIIVMGDFNDNPNNKSLELIEEDGGLFNPFKTVWSQDVGSLSHNFEWNLFDQILFSTNFFNTKESQLTFDKADVYNIKTLTQYHGKYSGQPFRTYIGKKYKGGYSDHFPVFITLRNT